MIILHGFHKTLFHSNSRVKYVISSVFQNTISVEASCWMCFLVAPVWAKIAMIHPKNQRWTYQESNEKKKGPLDAPPDVWCIYGGYTTQLFGDIKYYKINHFNRDPFFKQPVFYGKFFDVFFFVAQKNIREFGKFQEDDNMGRWMKLGLFSWDFFVVSPHPKRSHPEAHVIFRAS